MLYHVRACGLPAPEEQFVFAPPRAWAADFAWPDLRLLVECEGSGARGLGRHQRPAGYERDLIKYNTAALAGWFVLRFNRRLIRNGTAITQIEEFIQRRRAP